jgi:transcriptional regulator with XRE-family HTH domain
MTELQLQTDTVFHTRGDFDTLGGRISRARDAMNLTSSQLARRLGVKSETVAAWESDRSEPRANRLTMLAGVMGVSPTWLLNGVGDAPQDGRLNSELHLIEMQLAKLKDNQAEAAKIIAALETELAKVSAGRSR